MPNNEAAWLVAKHAPLQVKDAPYTEPGAGEMLVSNHAVAVNPVDLFKPSGGDLMFKWIKYPFWRRLGASPHRSLSCASDVPRPPSYAPVSIAILLSQAIWCAKRR
jgi:hypothetical protein